VYVSAQLGTTYENPEEKCDSAVIANGCYGKISTDVAKHTVTALKSLSDSTESRKNI